MTVHGAKGLQAPIVILPDTVRIPDQPSLLLHNDHGEACLALGKPGLHPALGRLKEAHKTRDLAEYQRLLYVALTRAEHHLIITGWHSGAAALLGSWYDFMSACAPLTVPNVEKAPCFLGKKTSFLERPLFMDAPLPDETRASFQPLTATPASSTPHEEACLRGVVVHKALENYMLYKEISPLIGHLLEREAIKALLDLGVPEVPIMGSLEGDFYSVRVDCLIMGQGILQIVDFKTGMRPEGSIPEPYKKQLSLYKALAQKVFPHHAIETYLLWTDIGFLEKGV
jgi:ATP-dependent helicase/nuclease subunit A